MKKGFVNCRYYCGADRGFLIGSYNVIGVQQENIASAQADIDTDAAAPGRSDPEPGQYGEELCGS